jgi:DNA-binding response OmpR family regulator
MSGENFINKSREELIQHYRAALIALGDPVMLAWQAEEQAAENDSLQLGDVQVDFSAHKVRRGDESIPLTPSEYEILITLASEHGDTVDYASLAKSALGYEVDQDEAKELIKRHIFTLRQKIGPDFEVPRYILNVRGYGYRLRAEKN